MKKIIFVSLFFTFISISCFSDPNLNLDEFKIAKEQSEIDKQSDVNDDGCYMECELDPFFGNNFHSIMGNCFKSIENPEVETFETILALNANGEVMQSWLNMSTNLSRCALKSITDLEFPAPPFEPYHARITVELK